MAEVSREHFGSDRRVMDPAGWQRCPVMLDSKQPAWQRKGRAAGSPLRGICAPNCTMLAPFSCRFSPVFHAPSPAETRAFRFLDRAPQFLDPPSR